MTNDCYSLPRSLKRVTLLEALVGSRMKDLHTTIFEVDVPPMELFDAEEEDTKIVRSSRSRDNLDKHQIQPPNPLFSRTGASPPVSPRVVSDGLSPSLPSFRRRSRSRQRNPADSSTSDLLASPLARIYTKRPLSVTDLPEGGVGVGEAVEDILSCVRKVEHMVEALSELPVGKMRAEMKELQVSHPLRSCHRLS